MLALKTKSALCAGVAVQASAAVPMTMTTAHPAREEVFRELTFFAAFTTGDISLQPYVLTGLSDSSPDWGGGFMVNWRNRSW